WAAVERIGPKRGTRIVLIGESCARGFPLDPFFNCAGALGADLAAAGGGHVEIVDLARLAIGAPDLLALLDASAVLEPDAYVIFAGNNWTMSPRLPEDLVRTAGENGWRAVQHHNEQLLRSQVAAWMSELTGILAKRQTPAVFVIPAENIRDF